MVRDGHAMSVAAQILKHMFWAAEGSFCVDHPVLSEQWSQPRGESLWLSQGRQVSMESQLAVAKGALESGNKLAAKDATEHLDGKKEGIASFDPVRVIGGESAGRNHAMDMRMKFEFLTPSVQHAEEADLGSEVWRIASYFEKGFRTGAKQKVVDDLLVLQRQWCQLTRQGEDHMDVACREKLLAPRCEPAVASPCLTLRAVPVAARVVGDGAISAASALIEMPAERGGVTGPPGSSFTGMVDQLGSDGAITGMTMLARKQPFAGFSSQPVPVSPEFFEQLWAEQHIAVFAAFAALDVNHHALTVDVSDFQTREFGAPESGSVERHQ